MTDKITTLPDHGSPMVIAEDGKTAPASDVLQTFFDDLVLKMDTLLGDQGLNLPSYAVANVPTATPFAGLIFITDEAGGSVPAFSDGTNWRRVTDRAIVS